MALPWPTRSVLAGTAGTAALTICYAAERRLRPRHVGPLDYDDSLVPGHIVASIMRLPHVTAREVQQLGTALRWGYGSAFGLAHGLLRRRVREPAASAIFGGILMGATLSLFPLIGRAPPPWHWPADVIATCLGTHAAYVFTVARVDDELRSATGIDGPRRRRCGRTLRVARRSRQCVRRLPRRDRGPRRAPRAAVQHQARLDCCPGRA
jgi:hypothetical protein